MTHCTLHSKYKAIKRPIIKCAACWLKWIEKNPKDTGIADLTIMMNTVMKDVLEGQLPFVEVALSDLSDENPAHSGIPPKKEQRACLTKKTKPRSKVPTRTRKR